MVLEQQAPEHADLCAHARDATAVVPNRYVQACSVAHHRALGKAVGRCDRERGAEAGEEASALGRCYGGRNACSVGKTATRDLLQYNQKLSDVKDILCMPGAE